MSLPRFRRVAAAAVAAASLTAIVPASAPAKAQDLKVMVRNVYLGADLIPLATAQSREEFERNAAARYQTVLRNDFASRAKALAAEIRVQRPDLIGVQEAAIWRTGPKDGSATSANDVAYDSTEVLLKELASRGTPYRVVRGRDWFDLEASTTDQDVRLTQRDVILVRRGSKVKLGRSFSGGFTQHFDPPTINGPAPQLRGWVGVDGTLARRSFRFVTTHLEAYSPDIAQQQMEQMLKPGGVLASKRRQSILVGDFNSAPGANANDRGTSRDASAYYAAIDAGFVNPLPLRATCCFAEDLHATTESLETWIDHIVVRPRVRALRSGIVGTRQIGGLYPSDHAGIYATLRLR
ncbi:MAG TPA: endonuclease/exonuclease/phosphatase family protein [Solirubrobacteraceae bacterium]|nr:endonuclease/exonuclease/phosphatase family protein [Solirubrobacteraceae bacterium]